MPSRCEQQAAVIAAIPFERRGIFIAMRHTLRPGEARAVDLLRWNEPDMLVQRWHQGALRERSDPRGLKEGDWRVVGADDELVKWVRWRIDQACPEEHLKRANVPLFPNPEALGGWWSPTRSTGSAAGRALGPEFPASRCIPGRSAQQRPT